MKRHRGQRFVQFVLPGICLALAAACGGGSKDAPPGDTATPGGSVSPSATAATTTPTASISTTPTVTATATPPPEAASDDALRAFAAELDAALAKGEVGFVISRMQTTRVTCTAENTPPQIGCPQCTEIGTSFDGFPTAGWRSEGAVISVASAAVELDSFLKQVRPADRDQYGIGAARVWGIGLNPGRRHIVLTAISFDQATTSRRAALDLTVAFCERDCNGGAARRWVITGSVTNIVLPDEWLRPNAEGQSFLGTPYELFRRPVVLTDDLRAALAAAGAAFGPPVKVAPNCTDDAPCIEAIDPGVAVDLGVARLSYGGPAGEPGGAAVFMGKDAAGAWQYWYGSQNITYRLADLPGDVIVCADGDGLNIREKPETGSTALASVLDGTKLRAEQFVLTQPGDPKQGAAVPSGTGWYRVALVTPQPFGWVSSKFVSDARLGSCEIRNATER